MDYFHKKNNDYKNLKFDIKSKNILNRIKINLKMFKNNDITYNLN